VALERTTKVRLAQLRRVAIKNPRRRPVLFSTINLTPQRRARLEIRRLDATTPQRRRDAATMPRRCNDAAMPQQRRDAAAMPRRRSDAATPQRRL
jgi:hypothetical protein